MGVDGLGGQELRDFLPLAEERGQEHHGRRAEADGEQGGGVEDEQAVVEAVRRVVQSGGAEEELLRHLGHVRQDGDRGRQVFVDREAQVRQRLARIHGQKGVREHRAGAEVQAVRPGRVQREEPHPIGPEIRGEDRQPALHVRA